MNSNKNQTNDLPHGLSAIAGHRDHITTDEFARAINVTSQTVRKNYCLTGEAYGIKPIKIGNRLLWGVERISERLKGNP